MPRSLPVFLLAVFFTAAGVNHFLRPDPYLAMIPSILPFHRTINILSGAAEILGGIGVLVPRFRQAAGLGLLLLLAAVFPANINVALHGWPGYPVPAWILWARLPLQAVLAAWVWRSCLGAKSRRA